MASSIVKVGDYEIDTSISNKLGRGTFADVFLGENVETKRKVAAKHISEPNNFLPREFDQEVDFMMRLQDHDNVVKILHSEKRELTARGEFELWMILEYCSLGNLSKFTAKYSPPMKKKIGLMRQSGCGLQYLHELKPQSIIHRDIKPANILISGTVEMPTAKVADFGISKFYDGKLDSLLSMTSHRGSENYMAPEMHSEDDVTEYNKKVDVYSMGVTFWALVEQVTGCRINPRLIDGKTAGKVLWENRSSSEYVLDIDRDSDTLLQHEVKKIISQMIALNPADRPTIAEVVDKLTVLEDALCDLLMVSTDDPKATWISKQSEWEKVADVPAPFPLSNICFCGVSTGIVGIGGGEFWGERASSQCHYFSVLTSQWRRLEDMPTSRGLASAVTVSADDILVFGGRDADGPGSSACEKLDMKNNRWSHSADMPQPLCDPLVTVAQGKVYILPRNEGDYQLLQYDPTTEKYEEHGEPLGIATATDAQLTAVANTLMLFQTGFNGTLPLKSPEAFQSMQYDLDIKQWSNISPVSNFIDSVICSAEAKDRVLLVCTESGSLCLSDSLFEYDPQHHTLTEIGFKLPRASDYTRSFIASISM